MRLGSGNSRRDDPVPKGKACGGVSATTSGKLERFTTPSRLRKGPETSEMPVALDRLLGVIPERVVEPLLDDEYIVQVVRQLVSLVGGFLVEVVRVGSVRHGQPIAMCASRANVR